MLKKQNDITKIVDKKNLIIRVLVFLIGTFIGTLSFNLFLVPNNIVIGGMTGLGIVVQYLFGISIPIFLNITLVLLFVLSIFLLDLKTAIKAMLGFGTWNIMFMITMPIASALNIEFNSIFTMLLFVSMINGVCFGLIYRVGFNTGGSDVILLIMNKYLKIPMGLAGIWLNIFIIGFGLIVFGPTKTLFAVFVLLLGNQLIDWVTLGVKDSKMCFVKSIHNDKIKEQLMNLGRTGLTKIANKGGDISVKEVNEDMLLIVVSIEDYYGFKHLIQEFDKDAFIMTTDCYAVTGGFKKQIIPF